MTRLTFAEVAAREVEAARKAGWYAQTLDQTQKQGLTGRPPGVGRKFTDQQLSDLLATGMTQKDAAAALGASTCAVSNRVKAMRSR
jgi:DNA-binding NarL/FixJ family response regulator